MGAGNAKRVYFAWAGKVPPKAHAVLVWMALTSIDGDAEPWCGVGHDELARFALGLDVPAHPGYADPDPKKKAAYDAVLRKVRRHITPLQGARAIRTVRPASYSADRGALPAKYRLYLDGPGPRDDEEAAP